MLSIPPPIASVHLTVDSMSLRVSKAHWFNIEVYLQSELRKTDLDTFVISL
jgi:hypothetical protein